MFGEKRVVDNRVLLLGLDEAYRNAMKVHERGELLPCARRVAETLHTTPADVPVEGYYSEDSELMEYFLLIRALQETEEGSTPTVASLPEFRRILDVVSSPIFGCPQQEGKLLPTGRDALSHALLYTSPSHWTVETLVARASAAAQEMDDYSLVGLAARAQDEVALTAARESVVLYAELIIGSAEPRRRHRYVWKVDEELAAQTRRFVDAFNKLFAEEPLLAASANAEFYHTFLRFTVGRLPTPEPANAEYYWNACGSNRILGRCVRLGIDQPSPPIRHYHWAVCREADGEYGVQEFWESEVWTTDRYRSIIRDTGRRPDL